ncbi:MAG: hypothetical protein OEX22_11965 [Cyclobacteriaceae bacterium]|nr:hypothetical protein [Cyclobacteriaceae bacterium]
MTLLEKEKQQLNKASLKRIIDIDFNRDAKIVAEGDSWFAYPLIRDVLDHLRKMGYGIKKCSKAGDTLENMVYGAKYKIDKKLHLVTNSGPENLDKVKEAVQDYRPRFFLFSAGGNDIIGEELIRYLNHIRHNQQLYREEEFNTMLERFMKPAITYYLEKIWEVDNSIDVLMDGYDYAKPNGKSYNLIGIKLSGPWILPGFGAKGITDRGVQETILKKMIDRFNEMLIEIDKEHPHFHHIDLRGNFPNDKQWHNEIHLKSAGFKTVAKQYHEKIKNLLGYNPI